MAESIKDFKDLDVWQVAREFRDELYKVAGKLPDVERIAERLLTFHVGAEESGMRQGMFRSFFDDGEKTLRSSLLAGARLVSNFEFRISNFEPDGKGGNIVPQ